MWDVEAAAVTSPRADGPDGCDTAAEPKAEVTAADVVVKMEREAKATVALVTHKANIEKECVPPLPTRAVPCRGWGSPL